MHAEPVQPAVHQWEPRPAGLARVGRDRRHEFPARGHRIAPTFTDGEYAAVVAAARESGLTPTGFCAVAALAVATGDRRYAVVESRREAFAGLQAEFADLRTAMVRVGTNLNQAVAALHATGEAPAWLRHAADRCATALAAVDLAASALHRKLS